MRTQRGMGIARSVALSAALLGLASAAAGGPLSGNLSLILGGLPPIGISGSGDGTSSASGATLPASVFATTGAAVPGTSPFVTAVVVTAANGPGAFTGATLHGPMAVGGKARLMHGGFTLFTIPLTIGGTRGVGLGGAPIQVGTSASAIALSAGTWSAGLVQLSGIGTPASLRTVSLAGSDQRTALGAGTLTLVTPLRITHSALGSLAGFGVLRLTFLPEPGAPALLAAAGMLLALGVRRLRNGR
jgi:hypothetical protein